MHECGSSDGFRYVLLCSTLSGKPVLFKGIGEDRPDPGLREEEVEFLRLLEAVSNGCVVELHRTGCLYKPGLIVGGPVQLQRKSKRNISYFLEPLILLGLFGKRPLSVTVEGVTHDSVDTSVDILKSVTVPTVARFCGIESGLELKILRRGGAPEGGGKVELHVPVVRQVPTVQWTDEGMVKRIRGVAYSLKVSPQFTNKMVDSGRRSLNRYLADVYIFTDAVTGRNSGNSPGYGLHLVVETTTGCLISSEASMHHSVKEQSTPEAVGEFAAAALLEEIQRGGVVDGAHQSLVLMLCAMGPELISEVRFGPLTPQAVRTLRSIRDFFGVTFDVRPEKEHGTLFLSCVGSGLKNLARKAT